MLDGFCAFAPALASANEDYPPDYFDILSDIDATHFWFRARGAMVVWAMRRHFAAPRKIFEIGCGTGGMLSRIHTAFPDAGLTGSDIYTAALPYAAARLPTAELLQMDATAIPFDAEFDVIAACDVLEHIERDDIALAQIHRALRPGGGIVLTVPQDPRLWSAWDELSHHKRRYTREELVGKVRAAGFTVERITSMFSFVYPLMRVTRFRGREACDPTDELRIAPVVNFLLGRVMDIERLAVRTGMSLPFGGSLLLVGRRA